MLRGLRRHLRALAGLTREARAQGSSGPALLLWHLPRAVLAKSYRRLAQVVNGRGPFKAANSARLRRFHAAGGAARSGHFYVIVMPGTLHFLTPCLRLIQDQVPLCLLLNGARAWERAYLAETFPGLPALRLAALPGSSLGHGDVLNLLLAANEGDFGVLDHDAFVFNSEIFADLSFGPDEFLLAYFYGYSKAAEIVFPYTHFLYFNTKATKDIVVRTGIDCRQYRKAPPRALHKLRQAGLKATVSLKDYHDYFDTLTLLYAVAYAEGWRAGFLDLDDDYAVLHLGGTSGQVQGAKALSQAYVDSRFLALPCNRTLAQRSRRREISAEKIAAGLAQTPDGRAMLRDMDTIIDRLAALPAA